MLHLGSHQNKNEKIVESDWKHSGERDKKKTMGNYGLHPRCRALTITFSLYDVHNKENLSVVYIDVTRPMVRCR